MKRKSREGNRRERKLTRLVLGALMLGAGTLWAPTAEAVNIPVTGAPTAAPSTIHSDQVYRRAYPQNNNNTWTLNYTSSDNAWANYTAYGAFSGTGGHEFTLQNGRILGAYGEYNGNGNASGKVTIEGGSVVVDVVGGLTSGEHSALNNTVTITDGTMGANVDNHNQGVFGGKVEGYGAGDAKNNTVTISGGTMGSTNAYQYNIYGGYANDEASSNTVTINSTTKNNVTTVPTFGTYTIIYGGYSLNGTANSNTVNINAGVTVCGIAGGFVNSMTSYNVPTGNTLNLGATGIKATQIAGVQYFDTIAITSGVPFTDGATVLQSTTGGIGSNARRVQTLDITGLNGKTTPGTMTLLYGKANDFKSGDYTLQLKYNTGTTTKLNSTITFNRDNNTTATNGAVLTSRSTHSVKLEASNSKVTDTLTTALRGVDLGGWDRTKAAYTIPSGWTSSLSANSITATSITAPSTTTNILTAGAGFFSDTYIANAIKPQKTGDLPGETGTTGVTFSGGLYSGVKASADGTTLAYEVGAKTVTGISLGTIAWNTGTAARSGAGYNFSSGTTIDKTNLAFSNPTAVTGSMTLLSNATGLTAGSSTSHSQTFSTTAGNGATLNATLNGNVTRSASALGYTATGTTLNSINLGSWTGTAGTLPTGWTKPTTGGVAVVTGNFSVTPTSNIDIFTTTTANFFGSVTGDRVYSATGEAFSIKDKGVILSGNKAGGVKATDNVTDNGTYANAKLTYFAETLDVNNVSFGNMTWGTPREATSSYTFERVTNLDASDLNFTQGKATALNASTNLLTGATNLAPTSITQPTNASVAVEYTEAKGIKFSGASTSGAVAMGTGTDADKVKYTITGGTFSNIDLGGWDGTEGRSVNDILPAEWRNGTGLAVNTGNFTATPATGNILTAEAGFFGTVTGDKAYSSGEAYTATKNGVTLTGTKAGGVKVEDSGATLKYYAEQRDNTGVALGTMTWGTGFADPASYDFTNTTSVDATNLKFTFTGTAANTIKANDPMDLLSNAANLSDNLPVTGSPHNQAVSYDVANVAKLSGTLSGAITTTGNTIHYTVTDKTLDSVDISAWNGTASEALDASWTKNANGISVTGSGFTKPTSVLDHTILTSTTADFFTDAKIDASIAYQPSGAYSETGSNITLSGKQAKGVRAVNNGQALAYSVGEAFIDNLALGAVSYSKGATLLDKSSNFYNYSNLNQIDTTGFSVTMTDDQKKTAQANDSMTLVQGNGTLSNIAAKETDKSNYTYTATAGLDVKGTVTGSVQATGNNVLYTVKDNTASDLTFGSVTWGTGTYARPNTEIAYIDAMVNAENITFTGVDTLAKDDKMVLVSNFGDEIKKTRGSAFTLANGKTGKGHAYWDSTTKNLMFVVDRGVDEEVQSKDATGGKDVVPEGQQRKGNVNGGEAEGDGESKGNEAEVKGSVVTNDDGTGGDVNGGTSEDGDADENKATVENSTVEGDVNGGKTDGDGDTEKNETTVSGSKVGGEVNGGHSGRGASRGNETKVDGSEVGGDVNGGKTDGDGDTEKNETTVTNGSKIGGDVNGGHSGGNGGSRGNETKVDGSEVKGDVNGGKTDGDGDTEKNETTVTNGSKIGGDVNGGHSGGSGGSKENKTKVDGSEVKGSVNGGKSEKGDAEKNETTVTNGSKIGGDINGGHSGGNGGSKENKTKVDGSEVGGDVNGGKSETGNTEKNETTVTGGSKVAGNVTGGSTGGSGSAKENKATVEGSTVGKDVIGGKSENGPSSTNTATVTNSTVGGNVAGGYSVTGAVTANTATLTDSKVAGNVSGSYSENGTVKENAASVTGGSVDGNVYGGKTDGAEPADTNTVDLDGGAVVNGGVFGGYSENGTADGNTVTVKSASIRDYVYGGKSKVRSSNDLVYFHDGTVLGIIGGGCAEAVNNKVTLMKGGVEEHVIGGFAEQTAKGNTVTMTGGTVNGSVIGGYGKATTANDNNVLLGGGTVKGATITSATLGGVTIEGGVYGGYGNGTTQNNTVTLYGTADVSATNLVGGSQEATGNTLNLGYIADGTPSAWTGGSQNVQNISNFENVNFSVVPWSESKAAVTITDGAKSDLSKATVGAKNVTFTGVKSVSVNDSMTLLDQSKAANKATNVVKDSEFTVGSFVSGTGTVSLDGNNNVIYNVESVKASEQTHNTVMGAEASMTALSVGNDFILDAKQGLGLQANIGSDGVATFAKLGGGKMKQETGSHINVNTWNAILALGHTNKKEKSSTEYGAFFEYGSGNYSTHNDADQRGDGSTRYTGGGLLAKWTGSHGLYVEGSFRAGTIHDDARNLLRDAAGMSYSYETDANYLGFSVGVGKEFQVADGNTVDVYGKYFYNRRNGADFTVGDGDFSLDAVTSSVLRVGARYTVKRGNWDFYAGAAYEHEMDGKANGRVNGVSIEGADVSGGSFRGEIGATMQPDEKSPWTLGLNVAGFAGKKQGVMGGVTVSFGF